MIEVCRPEIDLEGDFPGNVFQERKYTVPIFVIWMIYLIKSICQ